MTRETVIVVNPEFEDEVTDVVLVQRQVGYLSMWAMCNERYKHCSIYCSKDGNIYASYRAVRDGDVNYTIMCLHQEDGSYSHHS